MGVTEEMMQTVLQWRPVVDMTTGIRVPAVTTTPATQWTVVRIRGEVTSLVNNGGQFVFHMFMIVPEIAGDCSVLHTTGQTMTQPPDIEDSGGWS